MRVFFIATALGFFFAAQMYYSATSFGRSVSWGQALDWALGDWYEWALLSPAIFWFCRRFCLPFKSARVAVSARFARGVVIWVRNGGMCVGTSVTQSFMTRAGP